MKKGKSRRLALRSNPLRRDGAKWVPWAGWYLTVSGVMSGIKSITTKEISAPAKVVGVIVSMGVTAIGIALIKSK